MPKKVHVHKDKGLLEIIYTGAVTEEDLADDRDIGERVCRKNGLQKVLVDCSEVHQAPPTVPLFDHGSLIARSPVLRRIRQAIVVPEAIAKDAYFLETISHNRGVSMRFFTTRAEALKWLKESPDKTVGVNDQFKRPATKTPSYD